MMKKIVVVVLLTSFVLTSGGVTYDVKAANAKAVVPNPHRYTTTADVTYDPVTPTDTSNPPKPNDVAEYKVKGYGISKVSSGLDYQECYDLIYSNTKIENSKKFLSLFTMSDTHITDIQSPGQILIYGEQPVSGMMAAYSPTIMYTAQVLEAAVESINQINAVNKLDFGLMLGDAVNNAQQNELGMYLDVLTGRMVYPDSDMSKKVDTDYSQPFKSQGLNVPWYQVLGNHDHFWSGVYNANDKLINGLTSDEVIKIGTVPNSRALYEDDEYPGIIDVSDPYGKIIGAGNDFTPADKITPNVSRAFMDSKAFSNTFPKGHGINESTTGSPNACYTFEPKANVPVRVIVLDDTANQNEKFIDNGENSINGANGFLDKTRFDWFSKQLADANKNKKLVIIAAHVPLKVGLWSSTSEISEDQIISEIQKYSNVILLTAGHRHVNSVTAIKSPNTAKPELGFWQVETASLRDFPQQYRIYDILLNTDNTIAIKTTDVDTANTDYAVQSRSYAIAAKQIFPESEGVNIPTTKSGAYNAILYKKVSSSMADALKKIK